MATSKAEKVEFRRLWDRYYDDLQVCAQCGMCRDLCCMTDCFGWESTSPRGKIYLLKRFDQGMLDLDSLKKMTVEHASMCSSCGQCEEICPAGLKQYHMWEQWRADLVEMGWGPMKVHKVLGERVDAVGNPYNEKPGKRNGWLEPDIKITKGAELVFYTGCTASLRMKDIALAVARILNILDIPFDVAGPKESCCGSPLLRSGQVEPARRSILKNIEWYSKKKVKRLITACPGCSNTMIHDWPELYGDELPFKVEHISTFFDELLREGKLKFENPLPMKVTYHDPCHLGRHMKVYDEPRNIMNAIPGVELTEMRRTREMSQCCGAGGGFRSGFSEESISYAAKRVEMALDTGVSVLLTSCPFCRLNLRDGAKQLGVEIPVLNIEDIVLMSLKGETLELPEAETAEKEAEVNEEEPVAQTT